MIEILEALFEEADTMAGIIKGILLLLLMLALAYYIPAGIIYLIISFGGHLTI